MIGSGGWGTAMVTSLAARHDDLELYCRREEAARELKETRENKGDCTGYEKVAHTTTKAHYICNHPNIYTVKEISTTTLTLLVFIANIPNIYPSYTLLLKPNYSLFQV